MSLRISTVLGMVRKKNLIEHFCVVRDARDGYEEWFRSVSAAAGAVGMSSDAVESACRSGKEIRVMSDLAMTFRIVPARYRVIVRATGQELICRWDGEMKMFITEGRVMLKKSQVKSYEEVRDGDVQG